MQETLSAYEQKKNARVSRFRGLAEKNRKKADELQERSHSMADAIPLGQPILIGHHSERRDRKYRDRIWKSMEKSVETRQKADYYEEKARAAENNTAISSDDPDAIPKLKTKLKSMEAQQAEMKKINKIAKSRRKNYTPEQKKQDLLDLGYSEKLAEQVLEPNFAGELGIASYMLSNNNANIKRTKARIEELEQRAQDETTTIMIGDVEIIDNVEDNRLQVFFPGKPAADIRTQLKQAGFRWSRYNECWQSYRGDHYIQRIESILK